MNYIKQLNAAFEKFFVDDRLNPSHISLYMALFQEWNSSRFAREFFVNSREVMQIAKIGSKTTYHRCVTDLSNWEYLTYFPSKNPFKGSKIKMFIIEPSTEPEMGVYDPVLEQVAEQYNPIDGLVVYKNNPINGQAMYKNSPIIGQALVSSINNIKQIKINKHAKGKQAVLMFFKEKGFDAAEGKKFYDHYTATDWKTRSGQKIINWQAVAIKWMDRVELGGTKEMQANIDTTLLSSHRNYDQLKVKKSKNYGEPL